MASASNEIRSRQAFEASQRLPAAAQASRNASYDIPGEADPLYGWGRFPPQGKRSVYGGTASSDVKPRASRSVGAHSKG